MYLDNIDNFRELKNYKSGASTYAPAYRYWRNVLFSFVNKLFTWEVEDIPQKEIESRLIMYGKCGIIQQNKKLIAVNVNLYGITDYYDEFTDFSYATPLRNGDVKIGVNGVLIDNNTLRNDTYHLIHHYSVMLAHTEVTLVNALINGRTTETIIASSQKSAESARAYRDRVYKGAPDVIVDNSFIGLDFQNKAQSSLLSIKDLIEARQNILYSFYEDIGVKQTNEKKERMITDEVSANNSLLKLNIKDMFDQRIKACEEIERVFGKKATVKCNVDYDSDGIVDLYGASAGQAGGELGTTQGNMGESEDDGE